MSVAVVQSGNANAATTSLTVTLGGASTIGNVLVAVLLATPGTVTTASGWTQAASTSNGTNNLVVLTKVSEGETSATFASTGGTTNFEGILIEVSGASTTIDAYASSAGSGSVTSLATSAITTTRVDDLVLTAVANNNSNGGSTHWTNATNVQANAQARLIVGTYLPTNLLSGYTDTATWTTSRTAISLIVAISAPSSPPPVGSLAEAFAQVPETSEGKTLHQGDDRELRLVVEALNPAPPTATRWGEVKWGEAKWEGVGAWQDVTQRVRGLTWTAGATSPLDKPSTGTAAITLDNLDGNVSAWATTGEYVSGTSWLAPGTYVRFGGLVLSGGVIESWLPWFTGTIESMPESTLENVDGEVTLNLVDLMAQVAAYNGAGIPSTEPNPTPSQTLVARVEYLLDQMNYPGDVSVASDPIGDTATFLYTTTEGNRLGELQLVADSVGMRCLADVDGTFAVTSNQPADDVVSDAVFSNDPMGGELPLVDLVPYASTDRIVNKATYAHAAVDVLDVPAGAQTTRTYQYAPTDRYPGLFAVSRDDLLVESDSVVLAVVVQTIRQHGNDAFGIESVNLDMSQNPDALSQEMATLANSALVARTPITVRWVHPSGNEFTEEMVIDGMTNNITPVGDGVDCQWTSTFSTSKRQS